MSQKSRPVEIPISIRNTWQLVNRSRSYTAWLHEKYGAAVSMRMGDNALVVLLTPEGARQVLSGEADGYGAFWKEGFTGVAGSGSLWVLEGNRHRSERMLLTPEFHPRKFQGYGDVIRSVAQKNTRTWRAGTVLCALDTTRAISLEVILRIVFGVEDHQFFKNGWNVMTGLWKNLHPMFVFFPFLQHRWFPPWVRYMRAKRKFSDWVSSYLVEARRRDGNSQPNVLDRLLAASYEDGTLMSDEEIRDELITILLAGHETTATALAWALYDLGSHPDVLARLRAELDDHGPVPDPAVIARLPYLSAVCNETLRLHTLLPEIARVLVSPMNILGYNLPAGDQVLVSIMAIHHDPDLYPNPDEYNPENFLNRTYNHYEFLPFGGGHRRCLGASLSDFEMRIVLAEIVTNWEFEPAIKETEVRHDIAMGPKNGVKLYIKKARTPAPVVN